MGIEKILNLSDAELAQQDIQSAEQLFRLRFQMRMGQNDGLQKLRGLKKDVARIKTVIRQRQLGIVPAHALGAAQEHPKAEKKTAKVEKSAKATKAAKPKVAKATHTATAKTGTAKPKNKFSGTGKKAASSKAAGGKVQSNAMKGSR